MKTITLNRNIADPLRFMKLLRDRGVQALGVANPNKAGVTTIQLSDNQNEETAKAVAQSLDCGKIVLDCESPRGLMGCRAVKADGVAKHRLVIRKVKESGTPCGAPVSLSVVPTASVPLSAVTVSTVNGTATVDVGPMSTPLMLMVHVVDRDGNLEKRGMELSFEP
jgi:hypothetical protein